jgi:hypothetical protein
MKHMVIVSGDYIVRVADEAEYRMREDKDIR